MRFPRKSKIPIRQKRGVFSSLESAFTKGALSTFPPPRRLLHFLRIQPRKELSSATLSAPLQAHPSIGKDFRLTLFRYAPYNLERPHPDHHACGFCVNRTGRRTRFVRSRCRFQVSGLCFSSTTDRLGLAISVVEPSELEASS